MCVYNWKTDSEISHARDTRTFVNYSRYTTRSLFLRLFLFFFFSLHRTILSISFFEAAARNAQMVVREWQGIETRTSRGTTGDFRPRNSCNVTYNDSESLEEQNRASRFRGNESSSGRAFPSLSHRSLVSPYFSPPTETPYHRPK